MRKSYGNTWWGQQWLRALNNIDYSNRLPRGRTYANKGMVEEVSIEGNQIHALVAGSRPRPYKVDIEIPAFNSAEKDRIIELIKGNPLFLSKLLNRELPPELEEACKRERIDIFPNSWDELQGYCSCPDWAIPCKHLAAVLYLIANEIDKNPFLVFELHQFDLLEHLESAGYTNSDEKDIAIPSLHSLLTDGAPAQEYFEWSEEVFETLDFTTVPALREDLLKLLTDQPVFYPNGDFKKILGRAYRESSKLTGKAAASAEEQQSLEWEKVERVLLYLNEYGQFDEAILYDKEGGAYLQFSSMEKLMDWLLPIPLRQLPYLSENLRGLVLSFRLAQKLVEQSACVPQLLALENGRYRIRWLPAYLNQTVWDIAEAVETLTPFGLLRYRVGKQEQAAIEADDFPALLSVFISHYFEKVGHHAFNFYEQPIERLFLRGKIERFDAFEEKNVPQAIQLWCSRFFLAEKQHVPVLKVEEASGGFRLAIEVEDRSQAFSPLVTMEEILSSPDYQSIRMSVLRDLAMLSDHLPEISRYVKNRGTESLFFDSRAFVEIFFEALPTIRLFGIKVLLPKSLKKLLRPQLSMLLEGADDGKVSLSGVISLDRLMSFQWRIALGDQLMDGEAFLQKAKAMQGIVKVNDQYVFVEEKELQELMKKLEAPPALKPQELLQAALTEEYNGAPIKLDENARKLIEELLSIDNISVPKGLKAQLRPYQLRGYEWLYKNARIGFGSLIADDMGLGKTLQVITTLLKLKEEGSLGEQKALAILPTTLLTNWQKEINRFAPDLKPFIYHGPNRDFSGIDEADVVLTSYGIARNETSKLNKKKWLCLILDESQNIKNPATAQTKAIKKLKAPMRIAMSGTPVENRLSEYWSVFDFTNKGYLGGLKQFKENYAKPIELDRDQKQAERFKKITAPFIMRRLKTDTSIIQDLPDKIEKDQYCHLTPDQAALYQSVLDHTLETIEQAEGINRQGLVLKLITALKQVCNHPKHFLKKGQEDPGLSGKSALLMQLLPTVLENHEKALIFTQYQEMGKLLAKMIRDALGFEVPFLHGGCSRKQRDTMVEDFQTNRAAHFMILSLKAGGTGLNLTAASHVFHYDLWWNPAVEAQATDRAYRIGQERNVVVHRFITEATFEEKINQLLKKKKELADLTVSSGEKWIGELSDNELRELVSL
jgi:uncharacterized Zn finger protein